MTTALYRISSNEVLKISVKDQQFDSRDTAVFGQLDDPTTPDGVDVREQVDPEGPLRRLGFAKIAEPGTNNIRNASQTEIDTWADFENEDDNELDAIQANVLLKDHPQFRKMMTAVTDVALEDSNAVLVAIENLSRQWDQFKVDVAASVDFDALKVKTNKQIPIKKDFPTLPLSTVKGRQSDRVSKND